MMCGCWSPATARISSVKLRSAAGLGAAADSSLTATSARVGRCRPRHTVPTPPRPITASRSMSSRALTAPGPGPPREGAPAAARTPRRPSSSARLSDSGEASAGGDSRRADSSAASPGCSAMHAWIAPARVGGVLVDIGRPPRPRARPHRLPQRGLILPVPRRRRQQRHQLERQRPERQRAPQQRHAPRPHLQHRRGRGPERHRPHRRRRAIPQADRLHQHPAQLEPVPVRQERLLRRRVVRIQVPRAQRGHLQPRPRDHHPRVLARDRLHREEQVAARPPSDHTAAGRDCQDLAGPERPLTRDPLHTQRPHPPVTLQARRRSTSNSPPL